MANKQADRSNKPQFFKILLVDDNFPKKLSIPHKFVNDVIGYECKEATIMSSSGKSWHVQINRDTNRLYFEEGWQEFVNAHDLRVGYFLEFTYEGNMVFNVAVFDLTTCKKEYASIDPGRETDNDTKHFNNSQGKPMMGSSGKHKATTVREKEPRKCLQELKVRGPHFEVTIKAINLKRAYMNIPLKFEAHDDLLGKSQINLRNSKGLLWKVSLHHVDRTNYHVDRANHIAIRFGGGWRKFGKDNNLEEGDTCIFELVPEEKDVMQVYILNKSANSR